MNVYYYFSEPECSTSKEHINNKSNECEEDVATDTKNASTTTTSRFAKRNYRTRLDSNSSNESVDPDDSNQNNPQVNENSEHPQEVKKYF